MGVAVAPEARGGSVAGTGSGGTAGAAGGKGGTGGAGAGSGGGKAVEDEGADCTVPALPDAASLPTVARLPDPFTKLDGTRISAKAEWRCRRAEIKKQAERYVYGDEAAKAPTVTGTVSNTSITVNVSHNGRSASFSASRQPAERHGTFPAVVVLGGFGADTATSGARASPHQLRPLRGRDERARRAPTSRARSTRIYGSTSTTGLLAAWAWGVSRIIDVIEQSGGNILKAGCDRSHRLLALRQGRLHGRRLRPAHRADDADRVGHAPAFHLARSSRGGSAKSEQRLRRAAVVWRRLHAFTGSSDARPMDTHETRGDGCAARPPHHGQSAHRESRPTIGTRRRLAGAEVYKALGAGDAISYHSNVQDGGHCALRPEWTTPLRNALQRFLKKTGTAAGAITARSTTTGNLTEWRDWTMPTLN